jgi:hypothetical protein
MMEPQSFAYVDTRQTDDLGLMGFASATVPMFLIDVTLVVVMLLVEPKFSGPRKTGLEITTIDNRTLAALAASTIVFPVLLAPLVRWIIDFGAIPAFRKLSRATDRLDEAIYRKLGFVLSDFSEEFEAVLGRPDREVIGLLWAKSQKQRLRSGSYLLSFLPLAATTAILWGEFHFVGLTVAILLYIVAYFLCISAAQSARRAEADYLSTRGSLAVRYRFEILKSLRLRPPTNLADERQLWKKAYAVTVTAHDIWSYYPRDGPSENTAEERHIRYAYDPPKGEAADSSAPVLEEPWVAEYEGFVSAEWRPTLSAIDEKAGLSAEGILKVTIDGAEHGPNAEQFSVGGRRAPYAEFRVMPDSDDVDVAPSELIFRPSTDSAATGTFTTTRRRLGREDPRLWIRVYQHKRLVANLAVNWVEHSGDQE